METNTEITHAGLTELHPNPYQPRTRLEVKEEIAQEFGQSILEKGLLQIPVVRAVDKSGGAIELQMVDGWLRRAGFAWLVANGHAEYEKMPVLLRTFNDRQMADMVYVANEERRDLTPIDLAWYFKKYLAEFPVITQAEFARSLGKSQGEIANTMRLLELPQKVQDMIIAREITESHGRALLQLKESDLMIEYALAIIRNNWSVAETDKWIKESLDSRRPRMVEPELEEEEADEKPGAVLPGAAGVGVGEPAAAAGDETPQADAVMAEESKEPVKLTPSPTLEKAAGIPAEKPKTSAPASIQPNTAKPNWGCKLVIEEKGDHIMVSCMKTGGTPQFKKIARGNDTFSQSLFWVQEWIHELEIAWQKEGK